MAERTRPREDGAPPPLSAIDPTRLRRADTAVVLASGPSARVFEDPAVAGDPGLDVYALNHAAALPVPYRLASIEEPVLKGRQEGMARTDAVALLSWALGRAEPFAGGSPLVIRGGWHEPETQDLAATMTAQGAEVVVSARYALAIQGRDGPERFAEWARQRRPFRWPTGYEPVLSPRGGLGFLVSLCIALDYPTIVLAGVDMSSDEYFFDPWEGDPELDRLRATLRPASDTPHLTAQASGRRPSIGPVLVALDRGYLRPEGRRLLIGSASSRLHPDLELHEW